MTRIFVLWAVLGGFGGGSLAKMGEYPSMDACKQAVASSEITMREKTGTFASKFSQSEWRPLRGDFACVEAYK